VGRPAVQEVTVIPLAYALLAGLSTGPALDLDTVTLPQAAALDGQVVRATIPVVNPPDAVGWWSVLVDDTGAFNRTVVVPRTLSNDRGEVVRVVGVLETIRHPAATVNGANVPGWDEVRVTGWRVR
jgi:hypothetical protein